MELAKSHTLTLPLNFPQTFLPERRLLSQLLTFAQTEGFGDKLSIGAETNIPTGKSTGKVEPMIYYASGMGLIMAKRNSSYWQLGLTPLGHIIFEEDPFLSEPQTLWLLHLMLCRRSNLSSPAFGVADAWFTLFAEGEFRLGMRFSRTSFFDFLIERHGEKSYLKPLSGVVIRSYFEDSCFGYIDVLQSQEDNLFVKQSAPIEKSFFPFYTSYLYLVWDELFAFEDQVTLDLFSKEARLFLIMGWDEAMVMRWLDWMADKGIIQVDRYTGTPVLMRLQKTKQVLNNSYGELI